MSIFTISKMLSNEAHYAIVLYVLYLLIIWYCRWILKCHACFAVTAEIGRIFCPKCGNGGTLRKVAVTVNENGVMLAARRPRVTLRGTKVSNIFRD
jgi:hypothetical protein